MTSKTVIRRGLGAKWILLEFDDTTYAHLNPAARHIPDIGETVYSLDGLAFKILSLCSHCGKPTEIWNYISNEYNEWTQV